VPAISSKSGTPLLDVTDASQTALANLEALEILTLPSIDSSEPDLANIALAPEEIATLTSLMDRYDEVLKEVDRLNAEIESLLAIETVKANVV
jgi:hypothetical protein